MEKNFIVRVTRRFWSGDVRMHYREVWKFSNLREFLKAVHELRNNRQYMYEYFITSTSTPSRPLVRWSKRSRLPVDCRGKNMDLCGLVWSRSDENYDLDLPF